jgi:hypothetical protein
MTTDNAKAERTRMHFERISARNERNSDAQRAVVDEEKHRKAVAAKTARLRELRLARDEAERAVAAASPPVKEPTRKPAKRPSNKPAPKPLGAAEPRDGSDEAQRTAE